MNPSADYFVRPASPPHQPGEGHCTRGKPLTWHFKPPALTNTSTIYGLRQPANIYIYILVFQWRTDTHPLKLAAMFGSIKGSGGNVYLVRIGKCHVPWNKGTITLRPVVIRTVGEIRQIGNLWIQLSLYSEFVLSNVSGKNGSARRIRNCLQKQQECTQSIPLSDSTSKQYDEKNRDFYYTFPASDERFR